MKIVSIVNGINNYAVDKKNIKDNFNIMHKVALRNKDNQCLASITPFKIMRNRHYDII